MAKYEHIMMDDITHAKTKAFMTGGFSRSGKVFLMPDFGTVRKSTLEHSPALQKIIDEPITNISDQYLKGCPVTEVHVSIDGEGYITIYNTGSGVPVDERLDIPRAPDGRVMRTPEMVFSCLRTGSNLITTKDHSVGGVNGLGVKLTVIHSDVFQVKTVDPRTKQFFEQTYTGGLVERTEPILGQETSVYTLLRFLPTYRTFEYSLDKDTLMNELVDIIRLRVMYLSCFLTESRRSGPAVDVYFQNEKVPPVTVRDLLNLVSGEGSTYYIECRSTASTFIKYAVSVHMKGTGKGKLGDTSIVNGCVVKDGGHFNHLIGKIYDQYKKHFREGSKQEMKDKKEIRSYLTLVVCARLCNDNWGTQNKEKLEQKKEAFDQFVIEDKVIKPLVQDLLSCTKTKATKPPKIIAVAKKELCTKYVPPLGDRGGDLSLLLAEGDSAMSLLNKILSRSGRGGHASGVHTRENTGVFSLGGVPSNVAKLLEETVSANGEMVLSVVDKFYETKCFAGLVTVLGLQVGTDYSTAKAMASLKFRRVIICTDADVDGRGCICSLVLQLFFRLWPALMERGYVQIWTSPVVRVFDKKGSIIKEFKDDRASAKYAETMPSSFKMKYYKGLATHGDGVVAGMCRTFRSDLVTVIPDERTEERFDIYYSKDSQGRKDELRKPIEHLTDEEQRRATVEQRISCSRHLDTQTKEFMLYALARTFPALDSLTPVRRKVIATMLRGKNNSGKVYQVAGAVAKEMFYHHGDKSLHDAITKMAQYFPGSNMYPLLCTTSQVGSRSAKGTDAGQPRYVDVSLNHKLCNLLFPNHESGLLPKNFEEGEEVEPEQYIPILPLAVLEIRKSVSYGWNHRMYARDLRAVTLVMKKMLSGEEVTEEDRILPLSRKYYKGELWQRTEEGKSVVYAKGMFTLKKENFVDKIVVTELPLFENPTKYMDKLFEKREKYIENAVNYTEDDNVNIILDLKHGALASIYCDFAEDGGGEILALERFLEINYRIVEAFNFIGPGGTLCTFQTAYDVLEACVSQIQYKYHHRVARDNAALELLIAREQETIHFIRSMAEDKNLLLSLLGKEDEEIDEELSKVYNKYSSNLDRYTKYSYDELELALASNRSFNHLLSIRVKDLSGGNIRSREESLARMIEENERMRHALSETPPARSLMIEDIDGAVALAEATIR